MENSSFTLGMSYEALLQNTLGNHEYAAKTFQIMIDTQAGGWAPKPAIKYVPEVKKNMVKALSILCKRKELKAQLDTLISLRNCLEQTNDPVEIGEILLKVNDTVFPEDHNDPFYVALSQS